MSNRSELVNMSNKVMPMSNLKDLHCTCGAYLGKVVPGYATLVQCYCGEFVTVPKPSLDDQKDHQMPGQALAA